MLGADAGEDGRVGGEVVEDVTDCAAGCVVAGKKEEFNLAHDKFLESAVHGLGFSCWVC